MLAHKGLLMTFCIGATPRKRDEAERNRVCVLETSVRDGEFLYFKRKRLDLHQCSVLKLTSDMEVRSFFYARK